MAVMGTGRRFGERHFAATAGRFDYGQHWPAAARHSITGEVLNDRAGAIATVLVFLAVLFNAGLSIVNAHVVPLSSSAVIGVEVAIVLAAHLTILMKYRAEMLPWYGMIAFVLLFALVRGTILGHFEPKYVRDVLLIPTFVLLGMTVPIRRVIALMVALHIAVAGFALFEAFFTQAYSELFEVRKYYIATRSFDDSAFWNASSDLFVSATRPGQRFFGFIDLHRASSVFMEPVSLGNYVIITTVFLCSCYRHLSRGQLAFFVIGNLIALVACDGRLATMASIIIVAAAALSAWLPRRSALLYLPAAFVGGMAVATYSTNSLDDSFPGRVDYCMKLLAEYEIPDWLGVSNSLVSKSLDSGLAYTIATQSVIGLVLFWLLLVLSAQVRTPAQLKYLSGLCIYLVLTMLVSYSLFSIKTAALLWFIHGSIQLISSPIATRSKRPTLGGESGPPWRRMPPVEASVSCGAISRATSTTGT